MGETLNADFRPVDDYLSDFTEQFTLAADSTALVVIDMQYATASWEAGLGQLCRQQGNESRVQWRLDRIGELVIPNLQRLLTNFREAKRRVIYVTSGSQVGDFSDVARHYRETARSTNNRVGTKEHEILTEIRPMKGEVVTNKTTISAFNSSNIEAVLRAMGVEYLLFAGVSTNLCVDSTARDAAERGFRSVLIEDCCSAAKLEYHQAALITFQRLFGRVERVDTVIAELANGAKGGDG